MVEGIGRTGNDTQRHQARVVDRHRDPLLRGSSRSAGSRRQHHHERLQAEFKYTLSNFSDNNTSFNAIDPFQSPSPSTSAGGNNLGPVGTLIRGAYSLPPSNQAHQISGTLAYNFTPTTRLVTTGSWGLMLQNDAFAPDTLNSFVLNQNFISDGSSLNGQIQTLFGDATFTARPFEKTDRRATRTTTIPRRSTA